MLSQPRSQSLLVSETRHLETARMKGIDSLITLQKAVADTEERLGIVRRWTPDSPEWINASKAAALKDFQRACDRLEGLVVARCFEMTKMHQSEQGKVYA
jgi:hypothetical protein